MKIKKFEARTLKEAMELARRELGEDAVILNTREYAESPAMRAGANGRALSQTLVELVAAVDETDAALVSALRTPQPVSPALASADSAGDSHASGPGNVAGEVAALRTALESLVGEGVLAAHVRPESTAERRLRDAGVEPALAAQIVRSARSGKPLEELAQQWSCLFTCADFTLPEQGPGVFALVGSTGSGKTTALARLAAEYKFRQGRRVAVIGCDTQRLGASAMLKTLVSALDVPFCEAVSPQGLSAALDSFTEYDVIFIDTAGGSARDQDFISSLKSLLSDDRVRPVVVVPANLAPDVRAQMLRAFERIDPYRLIVSKLDEASTAGPVAAIGQSSRTAISHLTTGQSIPGGIRCAQAVEMALLVLQSLEGSGG
ncbi:MAG: hypothetical protein IT209_03725 [Armatimonadetes bacterium]|nr:hypothetical protein [Armatimonadota bacterium]